VLIVEVASIVSEKLVPGTICSIFITPSVSDINGIVVSSTSVTLALDSSSLVFEVECLGWCGISSLDNKSVGDTIQESTTLQCSLDEERSVDMHSPGLAVS